MKRKFSSELVYGNNHKYIKTKIKPYGDKANTNFYEGEGEYQNKVHHTDACHW